MENQQNRSLTSGEHGSKYNELSPGGFRSSVLESVTKAVPSIQVKWVMSGDAERRAMEVVTEGVRKACEISVVMSPTQKEAERHINEAEQLMMAGDADAMGFYLQEKVETIDSTLCRHERNKWEGISPAESLFISNSFGELCTKLDTISRDKGLVECGGDLRKSLFPKVVGSEGKRGSEGVRRASMGEMPCDGEKGVGDFLLSSIAKRAMAAKWTRDMTANNTSSPLRAAALIQTLRREDLRREDSPNVCMR